MSKKQKEEKPLTPKQAAKRAAGIAATTERRKARAAQEAAAKERAEALAKWTGDNCRELLPGEIKQEFLDLNAKITAKLDIFTSKASDAKRSFDDLIPELDLMHAMLSQRGRYRKLMNTLGLPSWTDWFKAFQKRCALDYSLKTVQRRLKDYRIELGEEPKPNVVTPVEDLFKRLNPLVPNLSEGGEHIIVQRLDQVTNLVAETKGDGLTDKDKIHLNSAINLLEKVARDFAAYAEKLKINWTGREQWLNEREEQRQRDILAFKSQQEKIEAGVSVVADDSGSKNDQRVQKPKGYKTPRGVYWVPPAKRPDIKGWSRMKAGEKLDAARAAGCIYCTTHTSARSCPDHGWPEKRSMASRSYVTPQASKQASSMPEPAITADANQPCLTP